MRWRTHGERRTILAHGRRSQTRRADRRCNSCGKKIGSVEKALQFHFMLSIKELRDRVQAGLGIVAPSIAYGVLAGTGVALLLPSVVSLVSLLVVKIYWYYTTKLASSQWANAIVAPHHLLGILIVALLTLIFIRRTALASLLRRCWSWTIYEATVLWFMCSCVIWTTSHTSVRILALAAGTLLTSVISWFRTPLVSIANPLINIDRPIKQFADDKLDRKPLVLSLVQRLIFDDAPVVALIGAYGDGKTSILNMLEQQLEKEKTVVVRFKSSLPGDDLTLVSTLFNSIGKQLRTRFFVSRLRNVLKRFARRISGLVIGAGSLRTIWFARYVY